MHRFLWLKVSFIIIWLWGCQAPQTPVSQTSPPAATLEVEPEPVPPPQPPEDPRRAAIHCQQGLIGLD